MKRLYALLFSLLLTTAAYGATPSTGLFVRSNCTTITGPVINQTWCLDTSTGLLKVYNGATYTTITSAVPGTVTNASPLTANLPVIGAGSNAVAVGTRSGNTTKFVTTTGTLTGGDCAQWDASGNLTDTGSACGSGGSGISQLTGDVTAGPGSGSQAATIANTAVTLAKIANAAASSKLVGSGASGSGASYSELTLGTNLSMSGTTLNAAGGTSDKTRNMIVTAAFLGSMDMTLSHGGGNFTTGFTFFVDTTLSLTAAIVGVDGTVAGKNVKITVWDRGTSITGSAVSAGTVTITSVTTGLNTGTFSSPITLTTGHFFTVGQYVTDASNYNLLALGDSSAQILQTSMGVNSYGGLYRLRGNFAAGDAAPDSTGNYAPEVYAIDLVY